MNTLIHKALLPFLLFMSMSAEALAEEPNAAEEADCTGTFSNMYYNLEAGDLLGEEIKIVVGARREKESYPLIGIFQMAVGAPFDPVLVDVRCEKNEIEFVLPKSKIGAGVFRGRVSDKGIHGTLTHSPEVKREIDLPRRASYWDDPISQ
ncbi:hypothetical protein [Desulfovibrio aminophilus]|uniref:hypothetical protein n=1 Tax=Desulfovibrio aminophilus TaxID=81425 RepID=UPI003397BE05